MTECCARTATLNQCFVPLRQGLFHGPGLEQIEAS
jgi:hypothetical protein